MTSTTGILQRYNNKAVSAAFPNVQNAAAAGRPRDLEQFRHRSRSLTLNLLQEFWLSLWAPPCSSWAHPGGCWEQGGSAGDGRVTPGSPNCPATPVEHPGAAAEPHLPQGAGSRALQAQRPPCPAQQLLEGSSFDSLNPGSFME